MSDRVRVKDPDNGAEYTASADWAARLGLTPLDRPAVDDFGRDIPTKYPVAKDGTAVSAGVSKPKRVRAPRRKPTAATAAPTQDKE